MCITVSYTDWEEEEMEDLVDPFQKVGTKKLRRIKEKAEKKAQREVCVCMCVCLCMCMCECLC